MEVSPLKLINSIISMAESLSVSPDSVLILAIWCFVGECFLTYFVVRRIIRHFKKNKPD